MTSHETNNSAGTATSAAREAMSKGPACAPEAIRLRILEHALADARDAGLEAAAEHHDRQAERLREAGAADHLRSSDYEDDALFHEAEAVAIRALKGAP